MIGPCLSAGVSQGQFTADQGLDLLWSETDEQQKWKIRYVNSEMFMIQRNNADVRAQDHIQVLEFLLTSSEQFCTEACIWVPWWLWGCQWSRSPQRPQRSRSKPSSSPSPRLRGWSLWQRRHGVIVTTYGQSQLQQSLWNVNKKWTNLLGWRSEDLLCDCTIQRKMKTMRWVSQGVT